VKAPNVMKGYLDRPDKTREVFHEGWYITGDIAGRRRRRVPADHRSPEPLQQDRWEMVPHVHVEEKLHELANATEQTFVVTSVADERKGERLVVLHHLGDEKLKALLEKMSSSTFPTCGCPGRTSSSTWTNSRTWEQASSTCAASANWPQP